MEALFIKEEEGTPRILLDKDKNIFEISGNSLPEDIIGFYSPVFKWVEEYRQQPNQLTMLKVKLNYFNSSSSKAVLDLIMMVAELVYKGHQVEVEWHYMEMDDDNLQTGKEFQGFAKIPFRFIPYQDDGTNNRFIVE
ncbi:MAG TPA: DUF1987 domain-containing protein [Bacteroidales bacterium]